MPQPTTGDAAPVTSPPSSAAPVSRLAEAGFVAAGTLGVIGSAINERLVLMTGAGTALAILAVVRFEAFVLCALVTRSALDTSKGGGAIEPTAAIGGAVLTLVLIRELSASQAGEGPRAVTSSFRIPLQLLLLASLLSALVSDDVSASLAESLRLAGVVAMAVALERTLTSDSAARRVLVAVLLSALVPMLLGAVQAARGSGRLIGGFSRVEGTFVHPNPFSIYLAVLIVLAVALLPHVRGTARWSLALGTAGAAVLLLLTYTRGSWIALVVGLVVVGAVQSRALVAGVLVATVAVVLLVPSVNARFSDLGTATQYSGAPANSLVWRVDYWKEAVSLSKDAPLTGIGLKAIERSTADAKNAHNDLVRVYVETGILGLGAYLALAVTMVTTARRALRRTTTGWRRGAAVGFAGVVSVLAVVSVSSNVITQVVLLWYGVALAMVAARLGDPPQLVPVSPLHTSTQEDR